MASAAGFAIAGWPRPDAAAQPGRQHRQPASQPRLRRLRAVAIDPGHGGSDPGAISPRHLYEKRLTLATAWELARQLEASGHYRPILTRRSDVYVSLRERIARAHAEHAELFLSIHADTLPNHALRGLSVYTLSEAASDREAAALARRENRDTGVSGLRLSRRPPEIAAVLFDLVRRHTGNRSLLLANAVVAELGRDVPLLERPHRAAAFVVLTAPDIPAALVELGCLSNRHDEELLAQRAYQRRLAAGLGRAIDAYFAAGDAA